MNKYFHPGEVWKDKNGNRIQAYGASLFYENGTYYWYGENKKKTDGTSDIWHWGVRCYCSEDLYNWDDMGLIIPPDLDDVDSALYPNSMMDRPHIVHNRKTGDYVCWVKIMHRDGSQSATILAAPKITGPYEIVKTHFYPLGMSAGDFDIQIDDDGRAYYFFEKVHSELICADLTADYFDVTGRYTSHFPHPAPPYVREAPAVFRRAGKKYIITSGTTGYYPNSSEIAVSDSWHGPYRVLGDPHVNDKSRTSFHSQISSVFKVPDRDVYIALADRWLPEKQNYKYSVVKRAFRYAFGSNKLLRKVGQATIRKLEGNSRYNTSIADYVWLPIDFSREKPVIRWRDRWSLEEIIG